MKLPYGIANFESLRTEGYFYVDKTRYLEQLEQRAEKSIILPRSRRFGKSLFCSMLSWYYDRLHADRFEELFGGTYIGAHPTPRHHAYMILSFDFSGINTETLANAHDGFTEEVNVQIEQFIGRYASCFSQDDISRIRACIKPNDKLNTLFVTLSTS